MGQSFFSVHSLLCVCGCWSVSTRQPQRQQFYTQTPPSYGFGRYGFGFFGPGVAFRATGALWGRATPFFHHFSVHEVWTPGPQKPQIISNENHHLALLDTLLIYIETLNSDNHFRNST